MIFYLLRRLGASLVVLFGISILVFLLLHIIYPNPGYQVTGPRNAWTSPGSFLQPWPVQYLRYIDQLLHGNLGYSYTMNQSVAALFGERWPRSVFLTGSALLLAILVAVPVGIYQAARRNSASDQAIGALSFTLYATPPYLFYLLLIQVFAFAIPIFSFEASQSTSIWGIMTDWRGMTLPIVGGALLIVAGYSRYMRSQAIDTLAQDYIKASRAKGLPERLVLWRHLLRNACLPMITLIGLSIPALLAGNLFAEYVFNYPGLGLLFYDALNAEDYPVLLAYTLVGAALTVAGNFIADVTLTMADPRIKLA